MGDIVDVLVTPLRIIRGDSGDVMHAMKESEKTFNGFGEAYFSTIRTGAVKGWKKHRRMILNLVVPVGAIKFVLYDDRPDSKSYKIFQEITLSPENYQRLTVPPGIWMAFNGIGTNENLLLNIASIPHDPMEADNLPVQNDLISYKGFFE
jgi:dTDP-4-dehydrorhamnose 3,5-epimerase